jgi:hypothetical protein
MNRQKLQVIMESPSSTIGITYGRKSRIGAKIGHQNLSHLNFRKKLEALEIIRFHLFLYAAPCAISSNQLHHTACLLLLDIRPPSIDPAQLGQSGSKLWHARMICGISSTNEHHDCLNNAIQPLWVAGKLLTHPAEHRALVNLICTIENKAGWAGKWRIYDLKDLWGYDRDAQL